jgi:hypothetical protein
MIEMSTRTTMATTTERRRTAPRPAVNGRNLRLYLIALLAAAYTGAWCSLGLHPPAEPDEEARGLETVPQTRPERGAVWFHDLPAKERLVVDLPAGWHVARPMLSPRRQTARVPTSVRASTPARSGRIRTRSS